MKKFLNVFVLLLIVIIFSSCSLRQKATSDITQYNIYRAKVQYAEEYMPKIEQCGNYCSMRSTYKQSGFLFITDTIGLFLSYQEEEYQQQKEAILFSYDFFHPEDEDLSSDCEASVAGYTILLAKEEYPLDTYKMGLLIGINDTQQKICYLYYYDFDLDVLDDLDEYIKMYFYLD